MDFRLYGNKGKNDWILYDPSLDEIDKALCELLPIENNFLILKATTPINNCIVIQTTIDNEENSEHEVFYIIEAHYKYRWCCLE